MTDCKKKRVFKNTAKHYNKLSNVIVKKKTNFLNKVYMKINSIDKY